jgi:hypothetical protein
LVEGTERVEVARKKTLELHGGHGPGIHPGVIARTSLAIAIMILHYRALQGTTGHYNNYTSYTTELCMHRQRIACVS